MNRQQIAALIAYASGLDPRTAKTGDDLADQLDQWEELLRDVPPTAPHPTGRHWNAGEVVRHHIATSPYPIKPSDVSRPWHTFKADVLGRHTGTFEPGAHPELDPDDEAGYRAALAADRAAVAAGTAPPVTVRELTGGPSPEVARRLAALGEYMPRTVARQLAEYRPQRAERERLAIADLPDALNVPCPYEQCRRPVNRPCQNRRGADRTTPHPSRINAATAHHNAHREQTA